MLQAGLRISNQWGSVQIDQNWRNYGFRQKVPVTITAYGTGEPIGYGGYQYQLVLSGTPALRVACRATELLPVKMHSYFNGSTWFLNWLFLKWLPPVADGSEAIPVTETVQFYVFDVLDFGTFSNVGLRVFNPSMQLVFHSDAPMMKLGYSGAGVQGCNIPFLGGPGRSYVPLILRNPIHGHGVGGVGYRIASHCLRVSGSTIITDDRQVRSLGASDAYENVGAYAAIDVTGL